MGRKFIDITGNKYGKLSVISQAEKKSGQTRWNCICDCGNKSVAQGGALKNGSVKSCGCTYTIPDLVGNKYGRLTVVSRAPTENRQARWNCVCDCGNTTRARGNTLKSGITKSCGCATKENQQTHGMTGTPTYVVWSCMKQRCYDKNAINYERYGERGITVCDRWLHSFENFYADMGERPKNKSIDRIDNSKGYSPDNCKWSTASEQAHNQRMRKANTSGYNGVDATKDGTWMVRIGVNNKRLYLGTYATFEEACKVRRDYEIEHGIPSRKSY